MFFLSSIWRSEIFFRINFDWSRTASSTSSSRLQAVRIPLSIWRAFPNKPTASVIRRAYLRTLQADGSVEDDTIVRAMCCPSLDYPLSNFDEGRGLLSTKCELFRASISRIIEGLLSQSHVSNFLLCDKYLPDSLCLSLSFI